jgi:hypothetical protein
MGILNEITYDANEKVWKVFSQPWSACPLSWLRRGIICVEIVRSTSADELRFMKTEEFGTETGDGAKIYRLKMVQKTMPSVAKVCMMEPSLAVGTL